MMYRVRASKAKSIRTLTCPRFAREIQTVQNGQKQRNNRADKGAESKNNLNATHEFPASRCESEVKRSFRTEANGTRRRRVEWCGKFF